MTLVLRVLVPFVQGSFGVNEVVSGSKTIPGVAEVIVKGVERRLVFCYGSLRQRAPATINSTTEGLRKLAPNQQQGFQEGQQVYSGIVGQRLQV
jgi:hypothetical protein